MMIILKKAYILLEIEKYDKIYLPYVIGQISHRELLYAKS